MLIAHSRVLIHARHTLTYWKHSVELGQEVTPVFCLQHVKKANEAPDYSVMTVLALILIQHVFGRYDICVQCENINMLMLHGLGTRDTAGQSSSQIRWTCVCLSGLCLQNQRLTDHVCQHFFTCCFVDCRNSWSFPQLNNTEKRCACNAGNPKKIFGIYGKNTELRPQF